MIKNTDIEAILKTDGIFVSTTSGVSMYPMLHDRQDTIIVTKPEGRLKKYDVALYKRGDSFVLHRVIEVLPNSYVIRGDNCLAKEYGITDEDVLGVLTGYYRRNREKSMKSFGYKLYSRLIVTAHPLVSLKIKVKARLRRRRKNG